MAKELEDLFSAVEAARQESTHEEVAGITWMSATIPAVAEFASSKEAQDDERTRKGNRRDIRKVARGFVDNLPLTRRQYTPLGALAELPIFQRTPGLRVFRSLPCEIGSNYASSTRRRRRVARRHLFHNPAASLGLSTVTFVGLICSARSGPARMLMLLARVISSWPHDVFHFSII